MQRTTANNILAAGGHVPCRHFRLPDGRDPGHLVAWALYYLFKPVDKSLSMLGASLRVAYAVMLGAAWASSSRRWRL